MKNKSEVVIDVDALAKRANKGSAMSGAAAIVRKEACGSKLTKPMKKIESSRILPSAQQCCYRGKYQCKLSTCKFFSNMVKRLKSHSVQKEQHCLDAPIADRSYGEHLAVTASLCKVHNRFVFHQFFFQVSNFGI
ncbi:hypothetical protein PIB30_000618 [Stylosanthes scabra]|uniref:Uncharacterized protein n=1 Tax=Stylosanthes scabra TaxID=79078 RepID=A0ABU6XZQ7_9FABA|nr:hypothetical protein [Stylosanthes scabra]